MRKLLLSTAIFLAASAASATNVSNSISTSPRAELTANLQASGYSAAEARSLSSVMSDTEVNQYLRNNNTNTAKGGNSVAHGGNANLGDGVKQYATRQYNSRLEVGEVIHLVQAMGQILSDNDASVIRQKVEAVLYDDRSSLVKPCDGSECATCPSTH